MIDIFSLEVLGIIKMRNGMKLMKEGKICLISQIGLKVCLTVLKRNLIKFIIEKARLKDKPSNLLVLKTKTKNMLNQSGMSTNRNLETIRERRKKALQFAETIKKPRVHHHHSSIEPQKEERFVDLDNNQYKLENEKIKLLFS